jgi:hypothetical protein
LFLCDSKVILFRLCSDEKEYIRLLVNAGDLAEGRKTVMTRRIVDPEILGMLGGSDDPDFQAYLSRVARRSAPSLLCEAEPDLFEELRISDVPSQETMDAIHLIRQYVIFDAPVKKKVNQYLAAYPSDWERWVNELDANFLIDVLNEKEETAEFAMRIASRGDSLLCRILSSIDSRSVEFCVANSPPIRAYNLSGSRRSEFEALVLDADPFLAALESDDDGDPVVDSLYGRELETVDSSGVSPAKAQRLLQAYEWEKSIVASVEELRSRVDGFLRSAADRGLPGWFEASLANERAGFRVREVDFQGAGSWGLGIQLATCPVCGMQHNLGESVSSIAVFRCSHIVHVSCLHTRYCPLCYASCLK